MNKRFFILLIILVLCCVPASAIISSGIFDLYKDHYSVAAVHVSEDTVFPGSLILTPEEEELFRLGVAAGYDRYRLVAEGLEQQTYVLNTKSMKFHDTLCMGGKSIKEENRQEIQCERQDLIEIGYSPCGICNP